MMNSYDLLVAEATQDVRHLQSGDPVVLYGSPELVPPGTTTDARLKDDSLPARPYVVYKGEGEVDEHGLPERFVRADRHEIEPAELGGEKRKVRKNNRPKRPEIPPAPGG